MEPDSEDTRTTFECGGRNLALKREWIMKGGEIADVAGVVSEGYFVGVRIRGGKEGKKKDGCGPMEEKGGDQLYILTSSAHLGPLTKSSVAKYPAVII
jgi:hypothetical protein